MIKLTKVSSTFTYLQFVGNYLFNVLRQICKIVTNGCNCDHVSFDITPKPRGKIDLQVNGESS